MCDDFLVLVVVHRHLSSRCVKPVVGLVVTHSRRVRIQPQISPLSSRSVVPTGLSRDAAATFYIKMRFYTFNSNSAKCVNSTEILYSHRHMIMFLCYIVHTSITSISRFIGNFRFRNNLSNPYVLYDCYSSSFVRHNPF